MSLVTLILAGGSGTRLWPASRAATPKQYLSFDGGPSYLQQALLRARGRRWVDFEDWQRIEAAEIEAAAEGAPRRKLYRHEDFLAVLDEQRAAG